MKGYFFNAQPTTDLENHPSGYDREYDALDYQSVMGVFFNSGVFVRQDPDACKVTASGLVLSVTPGVALVEGGQCHFEPGDGLTLAQGDGKYSVMCRRNNAAEVRGFQLIALHNAGEFPAPVREGDVYDLCLAHVTVTAGAAAVEDVRADTALCGFASLTAQPPYYPPDSEHLPYVLWLYTLGFPMTDDQKAAVEENPSLMEIYSEARTRPATAAEVSAGTDNVHPVTAARLKEALTEPVGDIKITTRADLGEDWLLCNGDAIDGSDYPGLMNLLPSQVTGSWDKMNGSNASQMVYFKGLWVYSNNSSGGISYSDNLSGPWSYRGDIKYSWAGLASNGDTILTYGSTSGSSYYGYSWTTDVTGTWNETGSFGSIGSNKPTVYAVKNGYYLAKRISFMNYTNDLSVGFNSEYNDATYYDDYIIVTSDTETAMFASADRAGGRYKVMGDTPAVWTTYTVAGAVMNYVKCAAYVNGYWVIGKESSTIYVTDTLTDPNSWVPVTVTADTISIVTSIGYFDGCYWVSMGDSSYWSKSLFDGWTPASVPPSNDTIYTDNMAVRYNNTGMYTVTEGNRVLPAMSPDKSYAYIKAK